MKALKASIKYRLKDGYSVVHEAIIENSDGRARGRRGLLAGTLCSNFFSHLISGTYFTSLMLAMDADDVYIGYISMLITTCGFFQMFAPLFLEKLQRRKTLLLVMRGVQNFLNIVVVGIIPLMPWPKETILTVFMITVFLVYVLNALGSPGYSGWHIQSLPYEKRVNYWTIQNMSTSLLGVSIAYIAGVFLDFFENNAISFGGMTPTITALILMRIVAVVTAALEIFFYSWIGEYPYEKEQNAKDNSGFRMLWKPIMNKGYMQTVSVQFLWTFITAIIGPYFSVYVIDEVKMSYSFIALGGVISTPIILIVTPIWGKLLQRKNWIRLMGFGMAGYSLAYFFNMLITSSTQMLYPIAIIICYIFSPCITIAMGQLNYLKLPQQNITTYLSLFSILNQGVSLLGTFLGTQFIALTENMVIEIFGFRMINKQYINMIQMCGILLLVLYVFHLDRRIRKEQEAAN